MKPNVNIEQPFKEIDIALIVRNPEQPRIYFDKAELEETAETIREHGVIQPIVVEECSDGYILHDGERRLLATKLAGKKTIPAIITAPLNGTGPRERLERALIANVQRSDMHAVEEGLAYQRLITEFGYSPKEVSKRIGKHYTRVNYCISLLSLDAKIQQLMMERRLPCDAKVRDALLSVQNNSDRVKLAEALGERKATLPMVVMACRRFNLARGITKRKYKNTPPALRLIKEDLPEWDALYQLGKVPAWPIVTESVMRTCDACPLRKMASDATCGDCPMVLSVKMMMEAARGNKH